MSLGLYLLIALIAKQILFIYAHPLICCCFFIQSFVVQEMLLTSCIDALPPTSTTDSEIGLVVVSSMSFVSSCSKVSYLFSRGILKYSVFFLAIPGLACALVVIFLCVFFKLGARIALTSLWSLHFTYLYPVAIRWMRSLRHLNTFFFQRSSDWDELPPVHKENENYESWTVIHLYGSMSYICLWCWCMWMICFYWSLFILIVYSLALCFMCLLNQLFFFYVHYLFTHTQHTCTHIHNKS